MVSIEDMYKYRSLTNDLYSREAILPDDLASKISDIYSDHSDDIESMRLEIDENKISFTFKEGTDNAVIDSLSTEIDTAIKGFLLSNVDKLSENTSKDGFEEFVNNGDLLYESSRLGDNLTFLL